MLKDKIERPESRGKVIQFYWTLGTAELKLMRGPTRRKSKQSKKAESQLLLPVADLKTRWEKSKEELHSCCQNTKRVRGERYFERCYRNGSAPWFREIKPNRRAFVSINRMRAGRTTVKASPSQGRYLQRKTRTQNERTQTSMPRVGFKTTIPVFGQAKTIHALERAATVIGRN
jgi:hypothetical protein